MALNPFIWDRPLDDPSKIVGMEAFGHQVALTLKGQTDVALFGPRDTAIYRAARAVDASRRLA
jgi:hypothetical protein